MSTRTPDTVSTAEEQFANGNVAAAFETLTQEVRHLQKENVELRERVDDLETQLEESATVRMASTKITDLAIETEDGKEYPLGQAIKAKANESIVETLEADVDALLEGEADVVVRSETTEDTLPIESAVSDRVHNTGNLSANEERATIIFPKVWSYATKVNGKLKLDSDAVKTILGEQTKVPKEDWNRNTVKRAMKQLAKLTSPAEDPDDRTARDEDNLLTLETGRSRLELVADREEWLEFLEETSED